MFRFDPVARYAMPAHFGTRAGKGASLYGDVSGMSVTYLTDRDALARYLPEPFVVGREPLVTVIFTMNREIGWLAGGSYNIVEVNCSAEFKGQADYAVGTFYLVLWESLTDPILSGRENLGIPKLYADIKDAKIVDGEWRGAASYRGHKILDIAVSHLEPLSQDQIQEQTRIANETSLMGWRYLGKMGEPGAEVSQPTLVPMKVFPAKEMWKGKGEVKWQHLTWEQNPAQHHIVNALADLPIVEYRSAYVKKGASFTLSVPGRPARVLR